MLESWVDFVLFLGASFMEVVFDKIFNRLPEDSILGE